MGLRRRGDELPGRAEGRGAAAEGALAAAAHATARRLHLDAPKARAPGAAPPPADLPAGLDEAEAVPLALELRKVPPPAVLALIFRGGQRRGDPAGFVAARSVNHSALSGRTVMPFGTLRGLGIGNSVNVPEGVTRPMLPALPSVDHTAGRVRL
jgi:hypothetical protein